MSQIRLPKNADPVGDLCKLNIVPEIIPEVENIVHEVVERAVEPKDVFGKDLTKKDEIVSNVPLPIEVQTGQGKRGKDKVKRKKKVMSQAQLDALALGRERSRAKRSAKKDGRRTKIIEKPVPHTKLDYETFSSYMDMYEDKKKTKHSTSRQPHPNKIINERLRPLPPTSLPKTLPKKIMKWKGTATSYQTNTKYGGGRWNF